MRVTSVVGGVILVLVGAVRAGAQSYPYSATIASAEAVARSGQSYDFYATSRLPVGTQVTVVGPAQDDPRWVQIKPPPGSFSWIDSSALSDDHMTVLRDSVPVYVGSQVYDKPPSISRVQAHKGEQVIPVPNQGPAMAYGREHLIMIAPLPREVRYIPASAIASARPAVAVQNTPNQPSPPPNVALQAAQPTPASRYTDRLWDEAERADARHDSNTAIPLYDRLSREEPDEARRIDAANRADLLRRGWQGPFGNSVAHNAASAPAGNPNPRPSALPAPSYATANPQGGLNYTWTRETARQPTTAPIQTATYASVPAATSAAATPVADGRPQWSLPGYLRRTGFQVAGRAVYALENSQSEVLLYATAEPGIDLETHRYRVVYLGGPLSYDGTLRKNFMRVTAVQPAR